MEFKVLSVLEKYMDKEQFTAFKEKGIEFEKALNVDIEKYVKANTPKVDDLLANAQKEVITKLGIESVETIDDLQKHIKLVQSSETEKDKLLRDLTTERDDYKTKYDTEVETRTQLEQESRKAKELEAIRGMGYNDPDEVEFLHFKLSKQVNEEKPFDTVVAEYAKENGVKTSTVYVKDDFGPKGGTVDIGEVWKAQRNKSR